MTTSSCVGLGLISGLGAGGNPEKGRNAALESKEEIREFLSHFDNDFFLQQFGDHAEITVTSEGVNIDEYEHD